VADVYLETGNYEEALRFAKKHTLISSPQKMQAESYGLRQ
jgi:hypothetical protein